MQQSYDKDRFKWVSVKYVWMLILLKDKSKAKGGAVMLFTDKLHFIQSVGVEVHYPNLIWEYSLSLIIALAQNL